MKYFIFAFVVLATAVFAADVRVINIETKKIDGTVHWSPAAVDVKPGETVKFVVNHKLEGGFDFHGFFIPELKIAKQVDRNKPTEIEVTIPKDFKPGSYKISCHFHPAHVPAAMIVK